MQKPWVSQSKRRPKAGQHNILRSERGQLVVEYVLLLIVAVGVAIVITSTMVSRNEETPGFLIVKWREIIDTIAADPTDDLAPQEQQ